MRQVLVYQLDSGEYVGDLQSAIRAEKVAKMRQFFRKELGSSLPEAWQILDHWDKIKRMVEDNSEAVVS